MIDKTNNIQHKVCVALLYITGARPIEIAMLKTRDFTINENDIRIFLTTKKRGINRLLIFDKNTPFVQELIIPYINQLLKEGREDIFDFKTSDRIKQIVYLLSDNKLTPYSFRHNRLTQLALAGATPYELMVFKGAKSLDSISPYIYRSPNMLVNLKDKIR